MDNKTNLRDMKVTTGSGKNVKETSQLSGEAKEGKRFSEQNVTTEYSTGAAPAAGPLGGRNTGS
jgi:hypothetical protein